MSTTTDTEEIDVMLKNIEATLGIIRTVLDRIKERDQVHTKRINELKKQFSE